MSVPAGQLQARSIPPIKELADELLTFLQELDTFKERGYWAFNADDIPRLLTFEGFPMAVVAYAGARVIFPEGSTHDPARTGRRLQTLDFAFDVLVAVEYQAVDAENTLPDATDLLDEVRTHLLGREGANNRVWRLAGEAPVAGRLEGVIWYGQQWVTRVSAVGDFQQP